MERDCITLEDGISYVVLKEIDGTNKYVYLENENDAEDIVIRKVINKDGVEILSGLDNESEFKEALTLYNN